MIVEVGQAETNILTRFPFWIVQTGAPNIGSATKAFMAPDDTVILSYIKGSGSSG